MKMKMFNLLTLEERGMAFGFGCPRIVEMFSAITSRIKLETRSRSTGIPASTNN